MKQRARTARRISPSRFVVSRGKHTYLIAPWPGEGVKPASFGGADRLAHARLPAQGGYRLPPDGWRSGRGCATIVHDDGARGCDVEREGGRYADEMMAAGDHGGAKHAAFRPEHVGCLQRVRECRQLDRLV